MTRFARLAVLGSWLMLAPACGGGEEDQGGRPPRHDVTEIEAEVEPDTAVAPCDNGLQDPQEPSVDCGGACAPCAAGQACFVDADCASGTCGAGHLCQSATCSNGLQDPDEDGIDCGGSCAACLGETCASDAECSTGYCKAGNCDVPTCADGVRNGGETGVDCGGPDCSLCVDGQGCLIDLNCLSGFCKQGFCATPSCADGARNQNETDVDCGGLCGGCTLGKACATGTDCLSGSCPAGICAEVAPTCNDEAKNGGETDVDCGGPCAGCGVEKTCGDAGDCLSGLCEAGVCVAPASCSDGQKNGGESDVDCGGPCTACPSGKNCGTHDDCLSLTCSYGVCKDPTCEDEVKNQDESDVDCGGAHCGGCEDGDTCGVAADCGSTSCLQGVCISCSDGLKNGSETDVDCGGSCKKCWDGKSCSKPSDCSSGGCEGGVCCTPNACGKCAETPQEVCDGQDNDCDGNTDEAGQIGTAPSCPLQQGVCAGARAACRGAAGWVCDTSVYAAHAAAYEVSEADCDGQDNDCDGQTDEGLLNACGMCGTLPTESCNGVDDDCDGQTDEIAACAACEASGESVLVNDINTASQSIAFTVLPSNWFGVLDGSAWMAYRIKDDVVLDHVVADQPVQREEFSYSDILSRIDLIVADGAVHLGFVAQICPAGLCSFRTLYKRYEPNGVFSISEQVASTTNLGAQGVCLSWAKGAPWMAYLSSNAATRTVAKRTGADTWVTQESFVSADDWGFHLVIDDAGEVHSLYRGDGYEDAQDLFYTGPSGTQTVCQSGCSSSTCATPCTGGTLGLGSAGTLYAVYGDAGLVQVRKRTTSTFGAAETLDTGDWPGLGFTPDGRPVVSYVRNGTELWVATRVGSSWVKEHVNTLSPADSDYRWRTAVGVDADARYHVGAVVRVGTTTEYGAYQQLRYALFCGTAGAVCTPSCAGKVCGDDGCGGSCGACPAGQTCGAGGQCAPASGCGANPSKTCDGACGGKGTGGCWCDDACLDYGNCCPDHEACCG